MAWLTDLQIEEVFAACEEHGNPNLTVIIKISLSTGCRWSEAANLKASQLSPRKITFVNTKGKKTAPFPLAQHFMKSLDTRKVIISRNVIASFIA